MWFELQSFFLLLLLFFLWFYNSEYLLVLYLEECKTMYMHMFYVNKGFDSESELLSEIKNETENIDFETNDK